MRGTVALVALLLMTLVFTVGPGAAEDPEDPLTASCGTGTAQVEVEDVALQSGGETVHGCLALPVTGNASVDTLVVMAHGFGHTVQASWVPHMIETVAHKPGVAAVAMNYRDNFGFPIMMGAEDTVQGTLHALDRFPNVDTTILYSISMGSTIGGTALHIAPLYNGGDGLYDHWFAIEPAANPLETYVAAKAICPGVEIGCIAAGGMEHDAGGTPAEAPEAWLLRSPLLHVDEMAQAGLQSVVVMHGLYDGLVPYDQGRELTQTLVAEGIPVEMYTVLRGAPDHTAGTTPTGHAGQPQYDPNEQYLHLAGHGSEADRDHIVTASGLDRLLQMLDGAAVDAAYAEHLVDHDHGIVRVL